MMSLREEEAKAIEQGKADFHYYMNEGLSIEEARAIIIKSTIYRDVVDYVNNYK